MPAATRRLTTSRQFGAVVRQGRRAGTSLLVVHAHPDDRPGFGLVVSTGVGGAVVRNRVKRRLRPLLHARMLGEDRSIVVRALPPAASASSTDLARALDSGLRRTRDGGRP